MDVNPASAADSLIPFVQARHCVVSIRVLDETRSGEHKFKVTGLVLEVLVGES